MFRKIWKSKMSSAALTFATKSALKLLIERETRAVGSRTVAYENVAKIIGTSSSWIRKFITYDDKVAAPRVPLFQNIAAYYDSICTRVEQEQQKERDQIAKLRDELHAFDTGANRLVAGQVRAETTGEVSR